MERPSIPARVLIVDDDEMSRDLLAVLLEAEGYAVQSAESGEAALELLGQGDPLPDLVLSDVQLPGISGPHLADKLRQSCTPATLLLAMSGSQPPDDAISRFDGFLLKPFKMEKIGAALAAHRQSSNAPEASVGGERWTIVTGPAANLFGSSKLVSIRSSSPEPASNQLMETQTQLPPTAQPPVDSHAGDPPHGLVLNQKIYSQLAGSMPARQLREMYAMCVNDARKRIAAMRDLAAAHDGLQFVRQAHAIKGSCGMLGATELYAMAAQLEGRGLRHPSRGRG